MTIVAVAGSTSRSGKTALACSILNTISNGDWTAIKFTTVFEVEKTCPRGTDCPVCGSLSVEEKEFKIITDPRIIGQPDTDTDRLSRSNSRRVVWCITRFSAIDKAWAQVCQMLSPDERLVIEGNSILTVINPAITFLVINPQISVKRWKDSTGGLIRTADFVCLNQMNGRPVPAFEDVARDIARARGSNDLLYEDVREPLTEWDCKAPLERLRGLPGHVLI